MEAEECSCLETRTECRGKCCKLIARLGQGHSPSVTNTTEANRFVAAQELFLCRMKHVSSPSSLRPTPAHMPSVYDTLKTIIILLYKRMSSKWCFLLRFPVQNFVRISFLPGVRSSPTALNFVPHSIGLAMFGEGHVPEQRTAVTPLPLLVLMPSKLLSAVLHLVSPT